MSTIKSFLVTHFWSSTAFHSFWQTFVSIMVVDGAAQLGNIYHGDLSKAALLALGTAVLRAILKAGYTLATQPVPTV